MTDYVAGADVRLPIIFAKNGDPIIPDVGTVTYSVLDHTLSPIAGLVDVELTTGPTTYKTTITIPASANSIGTGKRFERRTVVLSYEVQGAAETLRVSYRVTPELNHAVTPAQIRGFLGVNEHELVDADIDLSASYFSVEGLIGATTLATALVSGTTDELAANELIRMHAAMAVIPSLKQRLAQQEQNGVKMFARANISNFEELRKEAQRRFEQGLTTLSTTTPVELTLVVVTQDTDPVTAGG
jgi:tellurite resistance protein